LAQALEKYRDPAHSLLRIVVGFLFWTHGAQKLFGWLGSEPVELLSRRGVAGVLEFFGGISIMLGLFTQPVAFILSGEMSAAYFWVHGQQGFWPWVNRGELAALYSFIFLFFAMNGGGRFSLDARIRRKDR